MPLVIDPSLFSRLPTTGTTSPSLANVITLPLGDVPCCSPIVNRVTDVADILLALRIDDVDDVHEAESVGVDASDAGS